MTDFEKQWIDNASYKDLFAKVRFEPVGSPWITGDTGEYFMKTFYELRKRISDAEHTRISKEIGWNKSV